MADTMANAEPAAHQVRYTLTAAGGADFDLFYLTTQPPNKAAYNANPYAFVKKEPVTLAPGVPWVFETTLADPQWAIFTVSSTTHGGQAAPQSALRYRRRRSGGCAAGRSLITCSASFRSGNFALVR